MIMIQAMQLQYSEINGLDVKVTEETGNLYLTGSSDIIASTGQGKLYPQALACYFRGKKIPAIITCSEGGGINSDILT